MHTPAQDALQALRVEPTGVPIYVQLRDQLLAAIGAGRIPPGERMPTMREVAVALKVDLNTVRHAYEELEKRGAVVLVRGRGSFVADHPPTVDPQLEARRVEAAAQCALAEIRAAGVDPAAAARRLLALAQTDPAGFPRNDRPAARPPAQQEG